MMLVIFTLLAIIVPCYIVWVSIGELNLEKTTEPLWLVIKTVGSVLCVIMLIMGAICTNIVQNPNINNAHELNTLKGNTVYNVLEKFEDKRGKYDFNWRTYYWIEHLNGEVGLYYHTKTHNMEIDGERNTLNYGYYSLKKYNYKLFFTTIYKKRPC